MKRSLLWDLVFEPRASLLSALHGTETQVLIPHVNSVKELELPNHLHQLINVNLLVNQTPDPLRT